MPKTGCFLVAVDGNCHVAWWDTGFDGEAWKARLTDEQGSWFEDAVDFWMEIPEIPEVKR